MLIVGKAHVPAVANAIVSIRRWIHCPHTLQCKNEVARADFRR